MKFKSLQVRNLRAIRKFEINELGSLVVIAGANGCGKSCIFDAIRLLKSLYGGYQANEYHQWMGEFAVNLQDRSSVAKLFRDSSTAIVIEAEIEFASEESEFLRQNAESVVQPIAWQEVTGQPVDYYTFNRMAFATQLRQLQPQLTAATTRLASEVRAALSAQSHRLAIRIDPNGEMLLEECKPAEAAFQAYDPEHLGVIEYHSASRSYARQEVGGINLDSRAFEDQRRQHGLYNWQNKYQNVKSELASSYLRAIIARDAAGQAIPLGDDLDNTLIELFQTFFPDKAYRGVQPKPGGSLTFPVQLSTGEVHDIDEMSSGEKEILYGYLKLKNSTPARSVILLDEPELHLNPSLLQGFTDFYYRHLGVASGNQLWMVTHSDALLRQAVGNLNYKVFHMVPASTLTVDANQGVEVFVEDDVDRVAMDLVGDLATYRPHGKVVVLEGGESSEEADGFDVAMVKRLFPEFAKKVNLISGGNKARVRDLYRVLRRSDIQDTVRSRFFAVVDKDASPQGAVDSGISEFTWDRYHIENYLMDATSIRAVMRSLTGADPYESDAEAMEELKECAKELVHKLILERMQDEVNAEFRAAMNISANPQTSAPAADLAPSIAGSAGRIAELARSLDADELKRREAGYRARLEAALADGSWVNEFPGRPILRRFVDKRMGGRIQARLFMSAVLDKMAETSREPDGMRAVVEQIAAA